MITKMLVFLSSTSEMQAEREALANNLPRIVEVYRFEQDRARTAAPEKRCSEMIAQSDVFMIALGESYGSVFPGDGQDRSIVEWEFDMASQRKDLEILPFVKKAETREPRQQQFVSRITEFRSGEWCKSFATPPEFAKEASASLLALLAEAWQAAKAPGRAAVRIPALAALGVACVAALCMIGVVIAGVMSRLTSTAVIACSVTLFAVVAMSLIFYLRETGGMR